ncbi:MAG: ribulose-phosphate 3-epimerase [Actinomycetes bacterium]|jgi:ribulose-phosphate 3-epimerase
MDPHAWNGCYVSCAAAAEGKQGEKFMIRICPSILNANFDDLPNEIARVATTADLIHLDVMDNIFVPNFTFDFDASAEIIESSKLPIDVHLMVEKADIAGPRYATTKAFSVTIHYEATENVAKTLTAIKETGTRAGLAIKPGTSLEVLKPYLNLIDMILVMTVEPGFGGQSFMREMMPKVELARNWLRSNSFTDIWLQVDGGISTETIALASAAGADTFVAGSAIYKSNEPAQMVTKLRQLAQDAFLS